MRTALNRTESFLDKEESTVIEVECDYLELITKGISLDLLAHPLLVKGAHLE